MIIKKWSANVQLAGGLALATCIWMASGLVSLDDEANGSGDKEGNDKALFSVKVANVSAQSYQRPVKVRGRSEANRVIDVVSEVDGQIISTPAKEGSVVAEGDVLCRLSIEDREVKLEQSQALVNKAEIDYQGALKLKNGGYQSKSQIASAESDLARARAELKRNQLDLEKVNVRSPFTGVVEVRTAEVGTFVQRGTPCATLIELSPLVISGEVSEQDVSSLALDQSAAVTFINDAQVDGKVRYISSKANQKTRTFRIEIEIANADLEYVSGMSADVVVFSAPVDAHLINASLLSLEDDGVIGVRVVDDNNIVRFVEVEPIGDDDRGIWVEGLPDQASLITVGHGYVSNGQEVKVVIEAGSADQAPTPSGSVTVPAKPSLDESASGAQP